jgi:hypothetical protein
LKGYLSNPEEKKIKINKLTSVVNEVPLILGTILFKKIIIMDMQGMNDDNDDISLASTSSSMP